ncbi:MAG: protein jag [Clostridia bacterium]|nr:protein jag [Clostridia bacterium]
MEFTGKTVEEAVKNGLESLGLTEDQAEIEVVEDAVKGLFGKVKKEAVVRVTKKESKKSVSEKGAVAGTGTEKAADFILKVFDIMNIDAKAEITDENKITVFAQESSEVIGYRGEILDAIQVLAGAVANIGNKEYKKVVVDCENYRGRREETLIALAHRLEEKATETRRKVLLEPMSPFERRIIHTALADSLTVKTESDGKEPMRFVVIIPNDLDADAKPFNAGANHGRNRRDGNRGGRRNDRRGGRDFKGRGNSRGSGFTEEKRKPSLSFGTYLGNSLKDKNN